MGINDYIDQIIFSRTDPIKTHTIQIFKNTNPADEKHLPQPIGSGVLLKNSQHYYIATAAHVIESINETHIGVYSHIKDFFELREILYTQPYSSLPILDIAIWLIEEEMAKEIAPAEWWYDITQSAFLHQETPKSRYYIYGFPTKKTKIDRKNLKIIQHPFKYITCGFSTNPQAKHAHFNPQYNILLEFHKKKVGDFRTGRKVTAPDPFGISGCGLWYYDGYKFQLAGIMTEWKQQTERIPALMATKIDVVMRAINYMESQINLGDTTQNI